jgi:hypothetical protein
MKRKIPRFVIEECIKDFFPKWRDWINWKFLYGFPAGELPGYEGGCNREAKTIYIWYWWDQAKSKFPTEKWKLLEKAALIHEICHAVTKGHHNKGFLQRLAKCKARAEILGLKQLAILIMIDEIETKGARDEDDF